MNLNELVKLYEYQKKNKHANKLAELSFNRD